LWPENLFSLGWLGLGSRQYYLGRGRHQLGDALAADRRDEKDISADSLKALFKFVLPRFDLGQVDLVYRHQLRLLGQRRVEEAELGVHLRHILRG